MTLTALRLLSALSFVLSVRAEVEVAALETDDECSVGECALNALQVKSQFGATAEQLDMDFPSVNPGSQPHERRRRRRRLQPSDLTTTTLAPVDIPATIPMTTSSPDNESTPQEIWGNCVLGYHQTGVEAGHNIIKTGFDLRYAHSGIAGRGHYFATSIKATRGKAHHKGFCLEAELCLGHSKKLPRHPHHYTYHSLRKQGYDSGTIERGHGFYLREYVVYNDSQITVKRGWKCHY